MEIKNLLQTVTPFSSSIKPQDGLSSDDLFVVGMLFYITQLHQVVMSAWESFRKGQSEIRKQKEASHRSREIRSGQNEATRMEGERRQVALRRIEIEESLLHAGRPVRGKRLFHEGGYLEQGCRQLNLPV